MVCRGRTFPNYLLRVSPKRSKTCLQIRKVAGERAQQVRVFVAQTQRPEFKSQNPHKKLGMAVQACHPELGSGELESGEPLGLAHSHPSSKFSEVPCFKGTRQDTLHLPVACAHECTDTPNTCTHKICISKRKMKDAIRITSHLCH